MMGITRVCGTSADQCITPQMTELKEDVDVRHKLAGQTWQPKPEYSDGVVHRLKAPGQTATFLYRTVTVTEPRRVTGYFGSDDGIGIWLNRRRVLANDAKRGPAPNQE